MPLRWFVIAIVLAGACVATYFGVGTAAITYLSPSVPAPKAAAPAIPVVVNSVKRTDVPIYVSDCSRLAAHTRWRPRLSCVEVLTDIHDWLTDNRNDLRTVLA